MPPTKKKKNSLHAGVCVCVLRGGGAGMTDKNIVDKQVFLCSANGEKNI